MAAITAYRSRDTSQVIHLLNQRRDRHIFAMPPLFGYAMAFKNLASHIQNHSWYGLDFIEDDDRIDRYADILIKHQPEGEFILFGYSGGGNLAFETAKKLQKMGRRVKQILMIDSDRVVKKKSRTDEEIDQIVFENLHYFRKRMENDNHFRGFIRNAFVQGLLVRKMKRCIAYLSQNINKGEISADIHVIRSGVGSPDEGTASWKGVTTGRYSEYKGLGAHPDMTDEKNLKKNALLINKILGDRA